MGNVSLTRLGFHRRSRLFTHSVSSFLATVLWWCGGVSAVSWLNVSTGLDFQESTHKKPTKVKTLFKGNQTVEEPMQQNGTRLWNYGKCTCCTKKKLWLTKEKILEFAVPLLFLLILPENCLNNSKSILTRTRFLT